MKLFGFAAVLLVAATNANATDSVQLYTLDCGTIEVSDMVSFDKQRRFAGQSITLKVPCYLIRHPDGDLLWDAGLDEALAANPEGIGTTFHSTMSQTLTSQLAELGMSPADIEYLSLSHWHPDHAGNANLFGHSTWIANRAERDFMFSDAMKEAQTGYSALKTAKTILFDETYDVFGDGSAVVYGTPGHTPGHSVLLLTLNSAGALLFSGDLYIHEESRTLRAIPLFNTDIGQTLQSMDRFEALAEQHQARVVIEHDKNHFEAMPKFPKYLD
ncbi:MAG: N-acyl homoserine lactonase family protein [Kordiimonadaceae bacterium]|nr:N-acyl homoserine lactonase family protein [Kordiimonadaceae bacterium]MBO6567550.1 N-acyl homoserine lactonase family protein [Kordiimonadaceae bacterium]MBO6963236.1 N-acyl homoserine lactonase family protein [Kordiimonadaceae bacterium]